MITLDYGRKEKQMLYIKIRIREIKEKLQMKIAWALPKWLVMWSSVRMIAHATQGEYGSTIVPELSAMDALDRW